MSSGRVVAISGTTKYDWVPLLERVQKGDNHALEEFYRQWFQRLRLYFGNRLGWDSADDHAQDVFLDAFAQIQRGALANLSCFPGYIYTIAARRVYAIIDQRKREQGLDRELLFKAADPEQEPAAAIYHEQRIGILQRALRRLGSKQREILIRFYLYEQSAEQIQREMGLTETQYRLLKSRAKSQLGWTGQREIKPNRLPKYDPKESVRNSV